MSYVLAIDVGTSFTAAAILQDDQNAPRVPESLPLGLRGTAVPSVVYYPEEGPILVGEAAERRGLDSPERVVREFKRRVGDEVPISVGSLQLPAEDVFATMARWVADRAEEREGGPPSGIVLSHPASWGAHRTHVILGALAAKDLANVTLVSEPEAAALHYASQVRVEDGSTIAVYDLGGGTFDTAVLKKTATGKFELLGRPEGIEGLGGADFDAAVLRHVAEHAGEGMAGLDPSEPGVLAALARLRRECVEAKEALSSDSEASISVLLPGMQQQVRLVRSEFEAMISEPIRETVEALERSLEELGLEPTDLTAVLLIGGSSRIPLVAQLISEQLDRPIAVDADPKSSICLGAAVAALRGRQGIGVQPGEVAQPGAAFVLSEADGTQEAQTVPDKRRASWSRKSGAAFGPLAPAPAGAKGHGGAHAPGKHPGEHSKRSTARLTAVATAAALFTVLTATAAQSPEGAAGLSAMFGASEAGAAPGSDSGAGPQSGGAPGGAAGAAGEPADPVKGIEASANTPPATSDGAAGLEVVASPSSQPSASTSPEAALPPAGGTGSGGAAAGSLPAGDTGATSDPAQVPAASTPETPTTVPDPAGNPAADPPAPAPLPEPDPTTVTPVPEPDPTTVTPVPEPDPTTVTPVPEPDPTTVTPVPEPDPTTETPVTEPQSATPATSPTVTQSTDSTSIPTESAG